MKCLRKTIIYGAKIKESFLNMLLSTIDRNLSGNLLTVKEVKAKVPSQGIIKADEVKIRTNQNFQCCYLI